MGDEGEYTGGSIPNGTNNIVVKIGMIGDSQIGKTALMVKYVEGKFNEDYIETLGTLLFTINIHHLL
jgi:GTP-binding protein of the ras superfamily involved in termination of M-phase